MQSPQKDGKRRRVDDAADFCSPVVPAEIPRILADSKFLEADDLGRFLLLTSKWIGSGLEREEIFRHICHARFGPMANDLSGDIGSASGDWEWLFRQLSCGMAMRSDDEKLPSPRYSPGDYRIVINIYGENKSKPLISKVLPGERAVAIMDWTGKERFVKLDDPFYIGSACLDEHYDGIQEASATALSDKYDEKWSCSMHLLLITNTEKKSCCIMENETSHFYPRWDMPVQYNNVDERLVGSLEFHGHTPDLENDGLGLIRQIGKDYIGICFAVVLFCTRNEPEEGSNSVQLFLNGLSVQSWLFFGDGSDRFDECNKEKDVTLLHILEQLHGLNH